MRAQLVIGSMVDLDECAPSVLLVVMSLCLVYGDLQSSAHIAPACLLPLQGTGFGCVGADEGREAVGGWVSC